MKFITAMIAAVILSVGLGGGARAQDGTVSLEIRLTVEGAPCPNATYWSFVRPTEDGPGFGAGFVQLTDPDNDGVYTLSIPNVGIVTPFNISLIQGVGATEEALFGVVPGAPSVTIKELGDIEQLGSYVFEARVAGCQTGLPDTGGQDHRAVAMLLSALLMVVGASLRQRAGYGLPRM